MVEVDDINTGLSKLGENLTRPQLTVGRARGPDRPWGFGSTAEFAKLGRILTEAEGESPRSSPELGLSSDKRPPDQSISPPSSRRRGPAARPARLDNNQRARFPVRVHARRGAGRSGHRAWSGRGHAAPSASQPCTAGPTSTSSTSMARHRAPRIFEREGASRRGTDPRQSSRKHADRPATECSVPRFDTLRQVGRYGGQFREHVSRRRRPERFTRSRKMASRVRRPRRSDPRPSPFVA